MILVSCLLTSCNAYKTLEIETYNPATITFPPDVKTLMIINNAVQQPDSVGHRIEEMPDWKFRVSVDSTAYNLCLSLGKSISEAGFFDDVRLCEDTMRRDSVFYETRLFSKEEVMQICSDYGVDAFITLDRLMFHTNLTKQVEKYGFLYGRGIEIEASGELHAYFPGEREFYSFPFQDSLFWYDEGTYLMDAREDFAEAMRHLSNIMGEKLKENFVPYWTLENRWYYTSLSSEWKQGAVYAANGKWNEAETVWKALLQKTKNRKQQARLYSNLALCSEVRGDFDKAIAYAEKSCEVFGSILPEDDPSVTVQKLFVEILKKRLSNEDKLSKQLKELSQKHANDADDANFLK
jgi:tetratricopeptide (TPR) repeat protein